MVPEKDQKPRYSSKLFGEERKYVPIKPEPRKPSQPIPAVVVQPEVKPPTPEKKPDPKESESDSDEKKARDYFASQDDRSKFDVVILRERLPYSVPLQKLYEKVLFEEWDLT